MDSFDLFLRMSEELCGVPAFYLSGTGYAATYYEKLRKIVGKDLLDKLLAVYTELPDCCQQARKAAVSANLLNDDEFGPVVRNTMKIWFLATWFELPPQWHNSYEVFDDDTTCIPDPYAYVESLLGPAVGAHPAGAKPTGHQSWIAPPTYLPFAQEVAPAECAHPERH
jgi:hypothetical protein